MYWNWGPLVALIFIVALSYALNYLPWFRNYNSQACPPAPSDTGKPYRVYCRDFDVEVEADKLDAILDAVLAHGYYALSAGRLAAAEQDLAAWRASRDSAMREAAARIRAVTSQEVLNDTVVSLLIDHSGSMRGEPILFAARAAMTASDLLESLGAKQEVLGFTTVRWKGGLSREKWLQAGRPAEPGRLNDLLHIVYCNAGEKLQARHCATMRRMELLKENIDGEAIEWAASRLRRRGERHKYLIVMSDGAPVDDSTLSVNAGDCLERHLRSVIYGISEAGDIQLAAIGIGHDVQRYYLQSLTITTPEELDGAVLQIIEQLLCPPPAPSLDSQTPDSA